MTRLEDITRGSTLKGVLPDVLVTVLDVRWIGTVAIELTCGRLSNGEPRGGLAACAA
jgi:hypothetical protein